jgi:hypothetical protein
MSMLTIDEATRRLPFSGPSLRHRIAKGELVATRIAGRIYLSEAELREKFGILFRAS